MTSTDDVVRLDGRVLEGGGQLLRIAVGLSALLSRPISIDNIRGKRSPPGLKYQHAAGLRLVAETCSAQLEGCDIKSTAIVFNPQTKLKTSMSYSADPGTAGSIALLLQVSLPCLVFGSSPASPSTLHLRGGTNAAHAPQIDYTEHVFFPFLRTHFSLEPTLHIAKRGYFPKGGGQVQVTIPPVPGPLPPITLTERGELVAIHGRSYVAGLPKSVAEAMHDAAVSELTQSGIKRKLIQIDVVREKPADAVGSGSGIVIWAETTTGCRFGGSALGSKNVDPARVGREAAKELVDNLDHGGCVDEYMQDQMIIFLALAEGKSKVRTGPLSLHTQTAIWVVEQLTNAKFHTESTKDGALIECDGIGYVAPNSESPCPSPSPPDPVSTPL